MTTYTDIQALKARCTALETKDKALSAAATALTARVAKLEAVKPVDYAPQIAALWEEVDALRYIISSSARKKALAATASSFRGTAAASVILKGGTPGTYYNALTDGVCHGDGVTDDTAHILAAVTAYKAAGKTGLYFPAGTYLLSSTLTVPSGTVMVGPAVSALAYPVAGCNTPTAWLKGKVTYGSNSTFSDLRIGTSGKSTQNGSGATNTSFTRCQLRGGGGTSYDAPVALLGWASSGNHITFTDCNFERNCGSTDVALGNNIFSLNNFQYAGGVQVHDITWSRCHWGVDNDGVNTITPRAGIECTNKGTGTAVQGYYNISMLNCVFEKTRYFSLDFADDERLSDNVLVKGNWIKGAGGGGLSYGVCLECPKNSVVEDNLIYRCADPCIKLAYTSPTSSVIIRNNTFQLDYDNGISSTASVFWLSGGGHQIYGNTVVTNLNQHIWETWGATNTVAYGNTVTNKYAGASPRQWAQFSTSDGIRIAGTGMDATRNTLETYQTSDLGWEDNPTSGNTNLTTTPNILVHH